MPFEVVVADARHVKPIKTFLEENGGLVRSIYSEGEKKVIRTTLGELPQDAVFDAVLDTREWEEAPGADAGTSSNLQKAVIRFFNQHRIVSDTQLQELLDATPLKYTLYTPLLLFNHSKQRSFKSAIWEDVFASMGGPLQEEFFQNLLRTVPGRLTHVAVNMPIVESDIQRRPFNISPLYGHFGQDHITEQVWDRPSAEDFDSTLWCHTVQNGIHQLWAPMFTMFSRGNIKEKKRILDQYEEIEGNDVVDLYCGIGYFTFSYLARGCKRVFGFELNPWSVKGLYKGIEANNFEMTRCHIYNETNENCVQRLMKHQDLKIRHINLGLLPSSKQGWPFAIKLVALPTNTADITTLHIHENVHIQDTQNGKFVHQVLQALAELEPRYKYTNTHLEYIKTFAPDVWHVCLDVDCRPN